MQEKQTLSNASPINVAMSLDTSLKVQQRAMGLQTPFQYGSLTLQSNIFYSPLAGCSNWPFRQMSRGWNLFHPRPDLTMLGLDDSSAALGPGLIYCEMVKMDALVRLDPGTLRILDYSKEQHPIGAQIVGSRIDLAAECVCILQEMGFDAIDLNCGCPVDKVTDDGSGSGMLRAPGRIHQILKEMTRVAKVPISVKIRTGWDEESINAPLICDLAQDAGCTAIAIHGRTRKQAYKGPANWQQIAQCRERCQNILLIANGDINTPEAAARCFDVTGADALLASRATMGGPWKASEIIAGLQRGCAYSSAESEMSGYQSLSLAAEMLKKHYLYSKRYLPESKVPIEMRKLASWYLKPFASIKHLKQQLCTTHSHAQSMQLLNMLEQLATTSPANQWESLPQSRALH